jgi:hypothetical protein
MPKVAKRKTVRTQVAKSVINKARKSMGAPSWTGAEGWDGEKYHKFQREARRFYYTGLKGADLFSAVFQWMKLNDYNRDEVKAAKAASPYLIGVNTAITAKLLLDGMPDFHQEQANYLDDMPGFGGALEPTTNELKSRIKTAIAAGKVELANAAPAEPVELDNKRIVAPPTIQERIMDQACDAAEAIDEWLESGAKEKFNFKAHFAANGVTQAHARKIISQYQAQLDEYKTVLQVPTPAKLSKMSEEVADEWEQIKEGYSHMSKKQINEAIAALESIIGACDVVIDTSKANRKPRKAKAKSAAKLVEKLKYAVSNDELAITSISPEQIIGAQELWIYNTKTRKIGKYVAADADGLSVKSHSILNYDETKSISKTLRKPAEQLKAFKSAGKVSLRKFMDDIPTTDIKLNGRGNEHTILLKVQ